MKHPKSRFNDKVLRTCIAYPSPPSAMIKSSTTDSHVSQRGKQDVTSNLNTSYQPRETTSKDQPVMVQNSERPFNGSRPKISVLTRNYPPIEKWDHDFEDRYISRSNNSFESTASPARSSTEGSSSNDTITVNSTRKRPVLPNRNEKRYNLRSCKKRRRTS